MFFGFFFFFFKQKTAYEISACLVGSEMCIRDSNNTFVRGWSIDQENTEDYYVVRNIAQKKYSQKDYLWPVKYDDIIKNPNLKQNPGW